MCFDTPITSISKFHNLFFYLWAQAQSSGYVKYHNLMETLFRLLPSIAQVQILPCQCWNLVLCMTAVLKTFQHITCSSRVILGDMVPLLGSVRSISQHLKNLMSLSVWVLPTGGNTLTIVTDVDYIFQLSFVAENEYLNSTVVWLPPGLGTLQNLGKRNFKPYLELFIDPLFQALTCGQVCAYLWVCIKL